MQEIRKPTDRGKQRLVGASQIGGCPYHLGVDMAKSLSTEEQPEEVVEEGGLASWLGTAMHYWLQDNVNIEGAEHEKKVTIFDIEGYGTIKGHIDLTYGNQVWDWKLLGNWKLDKLSLAWKLDPTKIPDTTYRVQIHLYAYGLIQQGYDITHVNLVCFKKTSNRWQDVVFYTEPYNQELVDAAIQRAKLVFEHVRDDKVDELPRDEESCYDCSTFR